MSVAQYLELYGRGQKKKPHPYTQAEITVLALIMHNHTPKGVRFKMNEIEKTLEKCKDPHEVYTFFRINQTKIS